MADMLNIQFRKEYRLNKNGGCLGNGDYVAYIFNDNALEKMPFDSFQEMLSAFSTGNILMTLYKIGTNNTFFNMAKEDGCVVEYVLLEPETLWLPSEEELAGIEDDDTSESKEEDKQAKILYLGKRPH